MNHRESELVALLESAGPHLHRALTRLTLREDAAEDLMQELFVNLSQSDAFAKAADRAAYAYRAALNLGFSWRRSHQRNQVRTEALATRAPQDGGPLARMAADEELQAVFEAIERLPELQRNVVIMHYVQQDSYEMIARTFDKTPAQVRALCHKAICSLRRWFRGERTPSTAEGASDVERG